MNVTDGGNTEISNDTDEMKLYSIVDRSHLGDIRLINKVKVWRIVSVQPYYLEEQPSKRGWALQG